MAKQYKIKINGGPDNKQVLDLEQGSGDRGQMVRIKAVAGVRYQLEDAATGFAPENIRAKRVGKDLRLSFEGGVESDFLIEDYYEVMPSGYNAVIGQAENGRFYEYIPESASGTSSVQALGPNSVPVGMALGGSEVQASGAAVGVLVAAAGLNPLLLAPLGLLGLAGGGGGGSSPSVTPVATAHLTANATNDTGLKSDDGITSNNHPEISGTATPNSAVSVTINNKTYTTTAGADGTYQIQIPATDTLPDGVYPVKVAATLNGKTSDPIDGTPIIVDTSSSQNYSPGANPSANPDANVKATVAITSIVDASTTSMDSGASETDFITKDNTLTYKGTVTGFTNNGDALLLKLMDGNNVVIATTTVTPDSNGTWSWNKTGDTQADGVYTLTATVVDPAGNTVNPDGGSATQKIVIDSSAINNYTPDVTPDVNVKATVDILAITPDTGVNNSDFVTNNNTLKYTGKVTGFTHNGDVVLLELKNNLNTVVASKSVSPDNAGNWAWDDTSVNRLDGSYTLKATIIDLAGNTVNATVPMGVNLTGGGYDSQKLVIDTSISQNYAGTGTADANVNSKVTITSITDAATKSNDTGTDGNDFVTSDQTLSYKGTVATAAGAVLSSAWIQVELKDANGVLKASNYVQSDAQGNWLWNNTGYTTPEGKYTIYATVVDDAGNKVNTPDSHLLTIDLTAPTSAPTNIVMADTASVTNGTPTIGPDWITNSATFTYTPGESGPGVVTQFSLDSGKSWTTASSFPIDLTKDGVLDGTYAELQIKNLDAAGNPGPAAIYAHPFTIDTKAPAITNFALDTTLKTVGFSVDESGWYSYTITDATSHASNSAWTYLAVSPGTTSNVSIPLAAGTYATAHFQLNYQDVAGNMAHQSNATDWTLSAAAPSTIPVGSVQSSSLSSFQLTAETSLDLSNVSATSSLSHSGLDTAVSSGSDMLTLKLPDLLSQTSGIATAGMASSMLDVSIDHYNLVTLHDLVSTSTAGTWGADSHLGSVAPFGMLDPMADLLVHQASLNVN